MRRLAPLVAAVMLALSVVAGALGASSRPAQAGPGPLDPVAVPPDAGVLMPGIDLRLLGVPLLPVVGADPSAALAGAQARRRALSDERDAIARRRAELDVERAALSASQEAARAEMVASQARLEALAAAAYRSGAGEQLLAVLPATNALDLGRRHKLAGRAATSLREALAEARAARRRASEATVRLADETVRLDARAAEVERALPAAERAVVALTLQAASDLPARLVAGPGIPVAAFDAYLRAERVLAAFDPACGLGWWLLAGIAAGESGHGTHAGARADVTGTVFPWIVGAPLDGTGGNQVVTDTDAGLLDGNPRFDHAVGPMQFIPGTWRGWASDGNGDGRTDPQNLYDATLAAGRKLCADAGPGGLRDDDAIARALRPYSVVPAVVRRQLERGRAYEREGIPMAAPGLRP